MLTIPKTASSTPTGIFITSMNSTTTTTTTTTFHSSHDRQPSSPRSSQNNESPGGFSFSPGAVNEYSPAAEHPPFPQPPLPPPPASCVLFYNALKYLPVASAARLAGRVAHDGAGAIDALAHLDEDGDIVASRGASWRLGKS